MEKSLVWSCLNTVNSMAGARNVEILKKMATKSLILRIRKIHKIAWIINEEERN